MLSGAKALAVPTSFGLKFESVESESDDYINWTSHFPNKPIFTARFDLKGNVAESTNKELSAGISRILKSSLEILGTVKLPSLSLSAKLEFPMDWGLGSSSTLVYSVAEILNINAFELLERTYGGSGYDIACAGSKKAILYEVKGEKSDWIETEFSPPFKNEIHFVYLDRKMNSRDALSLYRDRFSSISEIDVNRISEISVLMSNCSDISEFGDLMNEHEQRISYLFKLKTVQKDLFPDYNKSIKSLGAWGGDFIMVLGKSDEMDYFRNKGYNTIIPFSEMFSNLNQ